MRSEVDPVEGIKKLEGRIIGIHVKDINEEGHDVSVGKGQIDFPAVVSELKRQNYAGFLTSECEFDWEDNTAEVKSAMEYINQLAIETN